MNGWNYETFSPAALQATGERWNRWYAGWNWLIDPEFQGLENIPENGPALFVGNHSLMALTDAVLMLRELYRSGTRENCSAMMQAGEHIIVYPGRGRR